MATREHTSNMQQSGITPEQQKKEGTTSASVSQNERQRPIEPARDTQAQSRSQASLARQSEHSLGYGIQNSPFALMRRMADDMDRLFEQFGFGPALSPRVASLLDTEPLSDDLLQAAGTIWSPQVETFRQGEKLVIRADIPGVKKDDIKVKVENDVLTISGQRRDQHEEKRDGYFRSERSYGQFYRAISLPEGVDAEKCEATFSDGVLEVTLPAPKGDPRRAKQIQVR